MTPPDERLQRALCSLEGLSVGDAFGEQFFFRLEAHDPRKLRDLVELQGLPREAADVIDYADQLMTRLIERRVLPAAPWRYTDDTQMALAVVATLRLHGAIDCEHLARAFGENYDASRGYGGAMHTLLPRLRLGASWQSEAQALFEGEGSFGNGAAMRVAPIGAYFADDLSAVVEHARRSAAVTHAHAEAKAGAIAVAVGAAWAWRRRDDLPERAEFLDLILPLVPDSAVKRGVQKARDLSEATTADEAAIELGNGNNVSAPDTVPFALWCAGEHLDNYEEALWLTVSGLGDRDTTCAIVGGIVACATGEAGIPLAWRQAREPLPN